MSPIVEMLNIKKYFGKVKVLTDVNFKLYKGEVHSLLGANGAGKSTLIKILGGVHKPTEGIVKLNDKEINFGNSLESMNSGISIIYQELSLVPTLSVIENIFLGREILTKRGTLDEKKMMEEFNKVCDSIGFSTNGKTKISDLSIADQQMVEIMKAVATDAEIIIMDEPTTSLTEKEKRSLFEIIEYLKNQGKSIIYISHILEDVLEISDSASIMRNGVIVGRYDIKDLDKGKIANLMTGEVHEDIQRKEHNYTTDHVVLKTENLSSNIGIKNVSIEVRAGEVVGFAGLVGSGRSEIVELLYGVERPISGSIEVDGKIVNLKSPKDAIKHGIALIPENRKDEGLIVSHEVYKNITAIQLDDFISNGILSGKKELSFTNKMINLLGIKTRDEKQKVNELSGGNQQKIVISKWIGKDLKVIVYDEPTKGIDIKAKEDVFDTIDTFARNGVGVIFISSDLEEVVRVSDRIYVVNDGKIIDEINGVGVTTQMLMNSIFNVEEVNNEKSN